MDIKVSVLCLVYNHGKYIRQALESMVNQKTDFNFEILVHDDASTDDSQEIIREFQEKYPDIVKPVLQTENQYSKGINAQNVYNVPRIRGKYVAYCEGDDYWTDTHKLQKQVDYMDQHPGCTFCIHNASKVNVEGKVIGEFPTVKYSGDIKCEDVILGGGSFCATNSIMAPAHLILNKPRYFNILSMDFVLQMYLASCGDTYCLNDNMSAYRVGVSGSWTQRMQADHEKLRKHKQKAKEVKMAFDKYTDYRYHAAIEESLINSDYDMMLIEKNYKELIKMPYKKCSYAKHLNFKTKCKIYIGAFFPFVLKLLNKE